MPRMRVSSRECSIGMLRDAGAVRRRWLTHSCLSFHPISHLLLLLLLLLLLMSCCCSGTLDAELQEGDTVLFISTLHGG
jgi:hypothetical protein